MTDTERIGLAVRSLVVAGSYPSLGAVERFVGKAEDWTADEVDAYAATLVELGWSFRPGRWWRKWRRP